MTIINDELHEFLVNNYIEDGMTYRSMFDSIQYDILDELLSNMRDGVVTLDDENVIGGGDKVYVSPHNRLINSMFEPVLEDVCYYGATMRIVCAKNQTQWIGVTYDQIEKIKEILLKS